MRIAMAMRDRALDVPTASVDVSNRVMDTVWCHHMWKSCYSTASAVLDTQKAKDTALGIGKASLELPIVRGCAKLPIED